MKEITNMDCNIKIGDLCGITVNTESQEARRPLDKFTVFSDRPESAELNTLWLAEKPHAVFPVDYVNIDDMFVLLEFNSVIDRTFSYPKIITKDGNVGYLYLNRHHEKLVKAT